MSDIEKKVRKVPTEKRQGPPCGTTPETAHGCGRPLPISDAPKGDEIAKLEAKAKKLLERAARGKAATVKPIPPKAEGGEGSTSA